MQEEGRHEVKKGREKKKKSREKERGCMCRGEK
jgi:hypothetical protein